MKMKAGRGHNLCKMAPKWVPGGIFSPPGGCHLGPLGRQVGVRRALWAERGESKIAEATLEDPLAPRGASRARLKEEKKENIGDLTRLGDKLDDIW